MLALVAPVVVAAAFFDRFDLDEFDDPIRRAVSRLVDDVDDVTSGASAWTPAAAFRAPQQALLLLLLLLLLLRLSRETEERFEEVLSPMWRTFDRIDRPIDC